MRFTSLAAAVVCVLAAGTRAEPVGPRLIAIKEQIKVDCPASSPYDIDDWRAYWPYGGKWDALAKEAFEQNQPALKATRELVRNPPTEIEWPADVEDMNYLNAARLLANNVGDAALYLHSQGNEAGALEYIRDGMALAEFLRAGKPNGVRSLVAFGVDAVAVSRLNLMTAGGKISQLPEARQLVGTLLRQHPPDPSVMVVEGLPRHFLQSDDPELVQSRKRFMEAANRVNAERTFTAMSLACHLFRQDNGRWPADAGELVPAYLPAIPTDPWGDGKQNFGYVVIKGGLPDGGDRPLVYSRCESPDGLFFRVDYPQHHFYGSDGTDRPYAQRRKGGQFRDVVRWEPPADRKGPTTQPLR